LIVSTIPQAAVGKPDNRGVPRFVSKALTLPNRQPASTYASLAVFFDRTNQPEIAATIYGTTRYPNANLVIGLAVAVDHLRCTFDTEIFDDCVHAGAAMTLTEAAHYAHHHINTTRQRQP
jgi:hypothetical protein